MMGRWLHTISGFRELLDESDPVKSAHDIAALLRPHLERWRADDEKNESWRIGQIDDLELIIENLEAYPDDEMDIDDILAEFYDWCDANQVWVALKGD